MSLSVWVHGGAPVEPPAGGIEVELGHALPVAFSGLRRLLRALEELAPATVQQARLTGAAEWRFLFPESGSTGPDLFELADAPNQRRLFRESEQVYRVLNFSARLVVESLRALGRPLVLRQVGDCDLVSLRGLMHAVEYARLVGGEGAVHLCDWHAPARLTPADFASTRAEHLATLRRRMGALGDVGWLPAVGAGSQHRERSLEGDYLALVVDPDGALEDRLASSLLAVRACFFSTNYEGATLAATRGLALLERGGLDEGRLVRAWQRLDNPRFDIPMTEIDQSSLVDAHQLRAELRLQLGVVQMFTGRVSDGMQTFAAALAEPGIGAVRVADLHMYRALTLTKRCGQIADARQELDAGLRALDGESRSVAALPTAWLRNLYALTYVQEKRLDLAHQQEELALASIDGVPGPSATHLKTNLVSNFSVLAEARRDYGRAIQIWRTFEPLNARLHSDNADKVHAFRLATLLYLHGDLDGAIASFEVASSKADRTGDVFNGASIDAALGRIHLDRGSASQAALWYGRAAEKATLAGDAIQLARALTGGKLARGEHDFGHELAVVGCDGSLDGNRLRAALQSGDTQTVLASLPAPKSKLTRPFDLVNV